MKVGTKKYESTKKYGGREQNMMHEPILLKTILQQFSPTPGNYFIDATAGEGGHTIPIAKLIAPVGKVLAIDRDPEQIKALKENLKKESIDNVIAVRGNFKNLSNIVAEYEFPKPHGILFDLGFSLHHVMDSGRGFTFQKNEPLDMRYNPKDSSSPTAAQIINSSSPEELLKILQEYGEENNANAIVREIIRFRKKQKIETTTDLVDIVSGAARGRGKIHPATKTFQALRIAVNNELENIEPGLLSALNVLDKQGQIAVITFHSLEDRLIKNIFKDWDQQVLGKNLTKKVIKPNWEEVKNNPRARSAKLRIFQKTL